MGRLAFCARCHLLADDVEDGSSLQDQVCKEFGGALTLGRAVSSYRPQELQPDNLLSRRPVLH